MDPPRRQPVGGAAGTTRSDLTTEYVISKTWQESEQTVPTPLRMTVAVLVDGLYDTDNSVKGQPKQIFRPRDSKELTELEDLVKNTIGFTNTDKRQDTVKVACAQFKVDTPEEEKEPFLSYPMRQMIQMVVEWGIIGLMGLLLILMVLRPAIKQILVSVAPNPYQALPAGAGHLAAGGHMAKGELRGKSEGDVPGTISQLSALAGSLSGQLDENGVPIQLQLHTGEIDEDDLDENDIPEELRGNAEAVRMFKIQKLAAQQARFTQAQAQKIHKEVVETTKANPQKTVSLMRQWMDEA